MSGWARLKIVLSVFYWIVAGFFCWVVSLNPTSPLDPTPWGWVVFGIALGFYVAAAALWWAFAGFGRR